MSKESQRQMALDCADFIRAADRCTTTAPNSETRHGLDALQDLAVKFVTDVITGLLGVTSIAEIARRYFDTSTKKKKAAAEDLVTTLLHQANFVDEDGILHLNLFSGSIVQAQARQLVRDVGEAGVEFVRALPTTPLVGVHKSYRGVPAWGFLEKETPVGSLDGMFATVKTASGLEESISLAAVVQGTDMDRAMCATDLRRKLYLSPEHLLSLMHPTFAMLALGGATFRVVAREITGRQRYLISRPRFEGPGESKWQLNSTQMASVVDVAGYADFARRSFGDAVDIPVQADGPSWDHGLERHHVYVPARAGEIRPRGGMIPNDTVREAIAPPSSPRAHPQYHALDREHPCVAQSPSDFCLGILMPGELRNTLPRGERDRGQALLIITQNSPPRWFSLLHRSDGTPAWETKSEIEEQLQKVVNMFELLEGPDSIAGPKRREHFDTLENVFNVPLSHPAGRQNMSCLSSATRQGGFPKQLFQGRVPTA